MARTNKTEKDLTDIKTDNGSISESVHLEKMKVNGYEMEQKLIAHQLELEIQNSLLLETRLKLEKSLDNFAELFDYAPVSYFILDKKGIIESINKTAIESLGFLKSELTGNHFSKFLDSKISEDNFYLHRMKIMDTGIANHIECVISCKDGSTFPAIISSSIIMDEKNKFKNFLTMVSDISDRKKAELELEEAYQSIRNLTEHIQNLKEEERNNFTHGIHDELAHQITSVLTGLKWIKNKSGITEKSITKKIDDLMSTLESSMTTVHKIMEKIHPSVLNHFGLGTAIEIHLKAFKRWSGIHINLNLPETEIDITDPQKIALFRIFQESLNNVVKHASAKNIDISLLQNKTNIELTVIDDGQGFDEKEISLKKTFGILGMKEWALNFEGDFEITSEKGKGTQIQGIMPIHLNTM